MSPYTPSTNRKPSPTRCIKTGSSRPHFFSNTLLSCVETCVTFTTESCAKPDRRRGTKTFPGQPARERFRVRDAMTTVFIID